MSIYPVRPLTLGAVHTYPLASRKSKVSVRDFAKPAAANSSLTKFLDSLPNILAAEDLRHLLGAIHVARKQRRAILWGIGGHVIKQADWIIDLGPEGGEGGGRIVAQGPPELVARTKKSYTGQVLARVLGLNGNSNGSHSLRNSS